MCESLLRNLIQDKNKHLAEFIRLKNIVHNSLKWVCQHGYDEHTIDIFWEELVELFNFIEEASTSTGSDTVKDAQHRSELENAMQKLHLKLNEENATSDYCTWFMRVMAAAQIKSNPDKYLPYVMAENCDDISSFCSKEVEPMGKECGMVQVSALAECMGVRLVVEYMDGRLTNDLKTIANHVFGDGDVGINADDFASYIVDRTTITMLYRPGHYDILYRRWDFTRIPVQYHEKSGET